MPVLSPHRSTSGGYRPSFSSSLERPYFPSSYSPRISSYSERFTTRTYTDVDGRKVFARSGSITEDGVTTRFREETRENSVRRDSLSRDSGISSIRESSILDYSKPLRESSLTRESSRVSAVDVLDSVAELRNKYSPANYVPACFRKNDNISRSKSINDIGLPPIDAKSTAPSSTTALKKKVNDSLNYNNTLGLTANNTNNDDNLDVEDDNGNRTSVADLRKKFDDKPVRSSKSSSPPIETPLQKVSENIFKKQDESLSKPLRNGDVKLKTEVKSSVGEHRIKKRESKALKNEPKVSKLDSKTDLQKNNLKRSKEVGKSSSKSSLNSTVLVNGSKDASVCTDSEKSSSGSDKDKLVVNGVGISGKRDIVANGKGKRDTSELKQLNIEGESGKEKDRSTGENRSNGDCTGAGQKTSRVNNYASFYPVKNNLQDKGEESGQINGLLVNGETDHFSSEEENGRSKESADKELSSSTTSPKLNNSRSTVSPTSTTSVVGVGQVSATNSNSSGGLLNNSLNSLSRRSVDRAGLRQDQALQDTSEHPRIYDKTSNTDHRLTNNHDRLYDRTGNSSTRDSPVRTLGLNGLKNIGNTCFMNSVIQCLSNTRPLLEYVRKDAYVRDVNTSISSMKGALIKAFSEVIKELWSEDSMDRVVNTVSLKSQIQRFAPRFMGYAQQDAQEFLRYLLEGLHEDVNRVTEKPKPILTEIDEKLSDIEKSKESWSRYLRMDNSRIVDIFVGQLKSTLRCTHCGHASVTFDPFWDLSLPIPQRTGQLRLSQCLDSFTREETLDGDEKPTCSRCKERRKCTKSFTIQKFPKILVIHLKRFSPTERFRGKLSVLVDFPFEGLDLGNYGAEGVGPARYNLYAVSNHSGTTYSGHYTAYCRHPYIHSWHEYNDSRVSSISSKAIVSSEAYVLFYELDGQKSHL